MLNNQQYLLACLAEECDEVSQRAIKALRFGMEETQPVFSYADNRKRLSDEIHDLIALIEMLGFDEVDHECIEAKKQKVKRFMEYSQRLGILEGGTSGEEEKGQYETDKGHASGEGGG